MSNLYFESTRKAQDRTISASDLAWPDEDIVRFVSKNYGHAPLRERGGVKALDLGFGTGRHLIYLATEGYDTYGLDFAQSAIEKAESLLAKFGLAAKLHYEDLLHTTFEDEAFDFAVAWGIIYLNPLEEVKKTMLTILRLLKPGGKLCARFRTTNNWFYGLGQKMEDRGFLTDDRGGPYSGNYYRFLTRNEVRELFLEAGFTILRHDYREWDIDCKEVHSYWIVWGQKPEAEAPIIEP